MRRFERDLIRELDQFGILEVSKRRRDRHYRIALPNGETVIASSTPRDPAVALMKVKADVRRRLRPAAVALSDQRTLKIRKRRADDMEAESR